MSFGPFADALLNYWWHFSDYDFACLDANFGFAPTIESVKMGWRMLRLLEIH